MTDENRPTWPNAFGDRQDQLDPSTATTSPHAAICGDMGAAKRFHYQHALTVFTAAGCTITGGDDLFAFGVAAPEGMSEDEFRELTLRAWYW